MTLATRNTSSSPGIFYRTAGSVALIGLHAGARRIRWFVIAWGSVVFARFDSTCIFRRFLNKDRMALNKLPDIDIDFAHDFKDDAVKLIFEKYGRNHCAVVGGFSTFQARSAFAEVA